MNLRPKPPSKVRYLGLNLTIAEWAKRLGVSRQRLHQRLREYPIRVALDPDPAARAAYGTSGRCAYYVSDEWPGTLTVAQIANNHKVSRRTVYNWAEAGRIRRVDGPRRGRYK